MIQNNFLTKHCNNNGYESSFSENRVYNLKNEPSYQAQFLYQLFDQEKIGFIISCIRADRLNNSNVLTQILREKISNFPTIDVKVIEEEPLMALLVLLINDNNVEDRFRDLAAETYLAQHPEDTRFEKGYAYLQLPHILIAHLLIASKLWVCNNPENSEFYDEQLAGLFHGTLAFDKGDWITENELATIQVFEDKNSRFPIAQYVEKKGNEYLVKKWFSTPKMCLSEGRIDDLFIKSRREYQTKVLSGYLHELMETSVKISTLYSILPGQTAVVAVIGPYGSGISDFTKQHCGEQITTYDLNAINTKLMSVGGRKQDHHFESMMVREHLLKEVAKIPVLYLETAAIDEYRFNRLVERDFSSRDQIIIQEIAKDQATINNNQFLLQQNPINFSRLGAIQTSISDAQRFRAQRIQKCQENTNVIYTLFCNKPQQGFEIVAKVEKGTLILYDGCEALYQELCPPFKE